MGEMKKKELVKCMDPEKLKVSDFLLLLMNDDENISAEREEVPLKT